MNCSLDFTEFEARHSYKLCSYQKNRVYTVSPETASRKFFFSFFHSESRFKAEHSRTFQNIQECTTNLKLVGLLW